MELSDASAERGIQSRPLLPAYGKQAGQGLNPGGVGVSSKAAVRRDSVYAMSIAGELLTTHQRGLWKRYEQRGGLASMTDDELREWANACRKLSAHADASPAKSAKARRLWGQRVAEAEATLIARTS
jgi:hypothetical protein